MDRSAVILAGGITAQAVQELEDKPLLNYVVDAIGDLVDEIIVVVDSQECADAYAKFVAPDIKFAVNQDNCEGKLTEALTGFETAKGEYTLVLPAGSPFVNNELLSLLFELCIGKSAVVPRWPDQQCEPLHAVYNTKMAIEAARAVLSEGQLGMASMVEKLRGVRYLSTMVIEQLDPDYRSFFIATTPADLRKASAMGKPKPKPTKQKQKRKSKCA
ncbi:MAG: molybdenum cofactor guanylyltransferase [Candidatus Bathyarchaeia archaeon]|jgi:molybdopterin-guanine dinucleotide biosynthesis protein A